MASETKLRPLIKPTPQSMGQLHPLTGDRIVQLWRDGRHMYWRDGDREGDKVSSVSGLVKHTDGDLFGAASGYTIKVIKEHGGDLDAPGRLNKEAIDEGNRLHDAVDNFIMNRIVEEDNGLFLAWMKALGDRAWITSERILHYPTTREHGIGYGGTLDALALGPDGAVELWDWKTKAQESYERNGGYLHEQAQLGGYADLLKLMGSTYVPSVGYLAYVIRGDNPYVDVVKVDLAFASQLFWASRACYLLKEQAKTRGSE